MGLGEGVALPSMNSLVATYLPAGVKSRALGISFTGFHCGNLLGLLLSPLILTNFGWRALFWLFGFLGAPLLMLWLTTVPEKPPSGVLPAQAGGQGSDKDSGGQAGSSNNVRVTDLLSHPSTWAIVVVNIVNHWGYFIYLNWMPSYFNKALGMDLRSSSWLAFLPWLVMAAGSSFAGAPRLARVCCLVVPCQL